MTTRKETPLIDKIKQKFGTVRNFAKVAGLKEGKLRQDIVRTNPGALDARKNIEALVARLDAPGFFLTSEDREKIRVEIYTRHRNVRAFCEEHPEFSDSYISHLLKKDGIKYRKGRVSKLFEILNIK